MIDVWCGLKDYIFYFEHSNVLSHIIHNYNPANKINIWFL